MELHVIWNSCYRRWSHCWIKIHSNYKLIIKSQLYISKNSHKQRFGRILTTNWTKRFPCSKIQMFAWLYSILIIKLPVNCWNQLSNSFGSNVTNPEIRQKGFVRCWQLPVEDSFQSVNLTWSMGWLYTKTIANAIKGQG